MQSLDVKEKTYEQKAQELVEAAKGEDEEVFAQAFVAFAKHIEAQVRSDYDAVAATQDTSIMLARGVRMLNSEEKAYYEKLSAAMRASNPVQAVSDLDVVMPKTIIDQVFEDLVQQHPLLDMIDFQNTGAVTEWLMNMNPTQLATWSPLCAEIVKELSSGFKKVDLTLNKLSAFLPVCKAMLDLGPEWLDRYVRAVLQEALYLGLEDGILNGRGSVQNGDLHEPVGMRKDMTGAIDPTNGYPDKPTVQLNSFNPKDIGALLAGMAVIDKGKDANGNQITTYRPVDSVFMVVNPVDYLTKVFPATTVRRTDGSYNRDVFPFPITVIQSTRIEQGKAIMGIRGRYFFGLGTARNGRIEYSDEYKFLEDERVYLIKLYGHGQPKDNSAFALLDISGLEPEVLDVRVVNASDFAAAGAQEDLEA